MQAHWIDDAAWASPWRARQVGEKVALSLSLVLTALVAPPWPTTLLVSLVAIAAIVGCARIPARVLALSLAAPLGFVALSALSVVLGIGNSATAQWRWGPFSVGRDALVRAAGLVGHSIAGTLALLVLATTTPMVDLLNWARRLRVPDPLIEVASLTYRLLWVLLATTLAIREAQAARLGDNPIGRGALRRRLQAAGTATGQVLVRSWTQARRLEDGLAGRGYENGLRTLVVTPPASWSLRLGTVVVLVAIWTLVALFQGHPQVWGTR